MKNRFSIYRDASGYLNYRVIDKNGQSFLVSADVSSWKAGQQHHVAASWALNSATQKDEMHLFIDGKETPTIITYGSGVSPTLHQKFRTISTDEIIAHIPKNVIGSTDLITTSGLNTVRSSLNFTALGAAIGDTIFITGSTFNPSGYTITNVNGNTLALASVMPTTSTNTRFSVNQTSFTVSSEINLYNNVAISTLHPIFDGADLSTTSGSSVVTSAAQTFNTGVSAGFLLRVNEAGFNKYYTIVAHSGSSLTLSEPLTITSSSSRFAIYSLASETELPGVRALNPAYEVGRDNSFNNLITINNGALKDDILLLRTFGLNHGRVRNRYYQWSDTSNILNTRLPSPIDLKDVKIYHSILDRLLIGPNNSSLSVSTFTSNNITTFQPSHSSGGRTLSITIAGSNVDFTMPVSVVIFGTINGTPSATETVSFTKNGTLNTIGKISFIDHINVICKATNTTKPCLTVKIRELYSITYIESGSLGAAIRYSYQMLVGNELSGSGGTNLVEDLDVNFSSNNIGNYLHIYTPSPVAGLYKITDVSDTLKQITLATNLPFSFANGNYEILNITDVNTGLQNGIFIFEQAQLPGTPYNLVAGGYEIDYHAGLDIFLSPQNYRAYVGTDMSHNNSANCIIDDFAIFDTKLTDTRIGESTVPGSDSITKHFNSLKSLKPSTFSLMLLDFESLPVENKASYYLTADRHFIQSATSVNNNFNKSFLLIDDPIIIDNTGILNTKSESSIEFWVSPLMDTGNDPNFRFYFDASGIVSEKITSTNNATVLVTGKISKIVSIKLANGKQDLDYFAGGLVDADLQTIHLNNKLPNQQTPLVVNYIPNGLVGDRLSIYKDDSGYVNFTVTANGFSYQVRAPAFWKKNTWHKLRAQFKMNQGLGVDEIRFFIDGKERGNVLFGNGLLFGQHQVLGSSFVGSNTIQSAISFKDTINELVIGSDYTGAYGAYARIDNLRISDRARPLTLALGESIDPSYSSNINLAYPMTEDLYTTLLLDFNKLVEKTTDFSIIKNKKTGLFDITINIFDSFGILESNGKAKKIMETLIYALKPANSRVFINYR